MGPVVLAIIVLGLFLLSSKKKSKRNLLFSFLTIIYLFSFVSTIIINYLYVEQEVKLIPVLYLLLILFLFITPFNNIQVSNIAFDINKIWAINRFSYIFLLITVIPTVYFAYYAIVNITSVDLTSYRIDITQGKVSALPQIFFNTVFSVIAPLYFINLILFFVSCVINSRLFIKVGLFITSFIFVFFTLCYAGRDGIVFWFFDFLVLYLFFRDKLSKKIKKTITWSVLIIATISISIFIAISVARFPSSRAYDDSIIFSLFNYYGQQMENFSQGFYLNIDYNYTIFPGFRKYLFGSYDPEITKHLLYMLNAVNEDTVFGFFVKNLVWGYGYYGTLGLAILFYYIINKIRKGLTMKRRLSDFILLFMLFQIPLCGVFYFRQSLGVTDFSYFFGFLLVKFYLHKV